MKELSKTFSKLLREASASIKTSKGFFFMYPIKAVSVSWSKVLNKPFILMQVLSKSAHKYGTYNGLNIFKMVIIDAAIFEAL